MKKILVAFDGSEGSEKALNKAISLLDEYGELILLAVVPTPSEKSFLDEEVYKNMKKKAETLINNTIRDIGSHDFTVTGIVEEGDTAAKIIDVANNLKCDLIVLGSKGTSEIGRYLLGSVANKVVQYAHKPVMVVR
ncbi:MAG: universal stress protein [Thermoplasmata archaeon]|nr:MAG: universal stress protein [Thermoplasmata archaeon]